MTSEPGRPADLTDGYRRLTSSCDSLLRDPAAHPAWLGSPFLHVISGHPTTMRQYANVLSQSSERSWRGSLLATIASHARTMVRAMRADIDQASGTFDVVLVGGLVDGKHLDSETDFYFGSFQRALAQRGVRSLLVLRNQTDVPTTELRDAAVRAAPAARLLLDDFVEVGTEIALSRAAFAGARCLLTRRAGATAFDTAVIEHAARSIRSTSTVANLRLEQQIRAICDRAKPTIVMTMYEGHAWERCVFRAARASNPRIRCGAYQHTILRESTHALRRSLGPALDPSFVICMGEVTRDELADDRTMPSTEYFVAGTHRRQETTAPLTPVRRDVCLVLPEGIPEEAEFLFSFALDAASRQPGTRYIFRSHPLLPVMHVVRTLVGDRPLPPNVEASEGRSFDDDLARSGCVLYRGSSTVLYGILNGLKPYYVSRPGELNLDPLYRLNLWRDVVASPAAFVTALDADRSLDDAARRMAWSRALDFARRYTMPEQPAAMDRLAALARGAV